MKVTQIAQILNETINMEQIGESAVVNEDLSNIVDVGTAVLDYTTNTANFDSFIGQMIDRIGSCAIGYNAYYANEKQFVERGFYELFMVFSALSEIDERNIQKYYQTACLKLEMLHDTSPLSL